jgi:hypothetical protein
MVLENWVLMGIFGSEIEEVTGDWRKWNDEFRNTLCVQYYQGDQFIEDGMGGTCGMLGRERICAKGVSAYPSRNETTWKT